MNVSASLPPVASVRDRFRDARAQTDELFELVHSESIYERPIPDRHRLIFYLGHLEAFDWNQICRGALDLPSFHPEFDKLFEFGIDPEPGTEQGDRPHDWPRVGEVLSYNRAVRARVDAALDDAPLDIMNVALEHRLMHAETLAYLLHALPFGAKRGAATRTPETAMPPENPMLPVPAGDATLGQSRNAFGWDNEFVQHRVQVPAFRISKYKITNGDYLRFVLEGAKAPHFWDEQNGRFFYRGMFSERPLPLDWPVYLSYDEAQAYASWVQKRLPTEAEFHRAAYGTRAEAERDYPWGDAAPHQAAGNFDFRQWDPVPITADAAGDSSFGCSQMVGNGWEWTSTVFGPFPGFEPFPFYRGYSADFFDGRHFVLKGGSPRTAADLLRRSFRNWFRPNYPYIYATFRLADNG